MVEYARKATLFTRDLDLGAFTEDERTLVEAVENLLEDLPR